MGGVMIRGRNSMAIAVRKMDGSIDVSSRPLAPLYKGKWREIPFIRGVIALIEAVVLGTGALMYSAQVSTDTEQEKITPGMIWGSVALGVVLAVVLFFLLPLLAARVLDPFISSAFISNLVEGLIRIIFFIVYLALIGRMQDIREIFAYHGAEHMSQCLRGRRPAGGKLGQELFDCSHALRHQLPAGSAGHIHNSLRPAGPA